MVRATPHHVVAHAAEDRVLVDRRPAPRRADHREQSAVELPVAPHLVVAGAAVQDVVPEPAQHDVSSATALVGAAGRDRVELGRPVQGAVGVGGRGDEVVGVDHLLPTGVHRGDDVAEVAEHDVLAAVALDLVVPELAVDLVVAVAAVGDVVAEGAGPLDGVRPEDVALEQPPTVVRQVGPPASSVEQPLDVAVVAEDGVVTVVAPQRVVAVGEVGRPGQAPGARDAVGARDVVGVGEPCRARPTEQVVVAGAAEELVVGRVALQPVVAFVASHRVLAALAVEQVALRAAEQLVVARHGRRDVGRAGHGDVVDVDSASGRPGVGVVATAAHDAAVVADRHVGAVTVGVAGGGTVDHVRTVQHAGHVDRELGLAGATDDVVGTRLSLEVVGPGAAGDLVVLGAAEHGVVAALAEEPVGAGLAEDLVGTGRTREAALAGVGELHVVLGHLRGAAAVDERQHRPEVDRRVLDQAVVAQRHVGTLAARDVVAAFGSGHRGACVVDVGLRAAAVEVVVAGPTEDVVSAAVALGDVVPVLALDAVVARLAPEPVVAGPAEHEVVAEGAGRLRQGGRPERGQVRYVVQGHHAGDDAGVVAGDDVVARPAVDHVVDRALHPVRGAGLVVRDARGPAAAGDLVDAVTTGDGVRAGVAGQVVVAGAAQDRVVSGLPEDHVGLGPAVDGVVAGHAGGRRGGGAAVRDQRHVEQLERPGRGQAVVAEHRVGARAALDPVVAVAGAGELLHGAVGEQVRAAAADDGVRARAAVDLVVTRATLDPVVRVVTEQGVVAALAVDHVGRGTGPHDVVAGRGAALEVEQAQALDVAGDPHRSRVVAGHVVDAGPTVDAVVAVRGPLRRRCHRRGRPRRRRRRAGRRPGCPRPRRRRCRRRRCRRRRCHASGRGRGRRTSRPRRRRRRGRRRPARRGPGRPRPRRRRGRRRHRRRCGHPHRHRARRRCRSGRAGSRRRRCRRSRAR